MNRLGWYKDIDATPYICKDFKDSGYCTWGDSCLYAHIRGESPIKQLSSVHSRLDQLRKLNKK